VGTPQMKRMAFAIQIRDLRSQLTAIVPYCAGFIAHVRVIHMRAIRQAPTALLWLVLFPMRDSPNPSYPIAESCYCHLMQMDRIDP